MTQRMPVAIVDGVMQALPATDTLGLLYTPFKAAKLFMYLLMVMMLRDL